MRNAKAPVNAETEHVTTGDIFADLGFSPAQAVELAIKSDLHRSLLEHIRASKRSQAELAKVLQVHQPDVSNLLRGKLNLFSITKLCQYADRLKLKVRIEVEGDRPAEKPLRTRMKPVQPGAVQRKKKTVHLGMNTVSKPARRAVA
jgi:predicted XRE-type DNA-binding protein